MSKASNWFLSLVAAVVITAGAVMSPAQDSSRATGKLGNLIAGTFIEEAVIGPGTLTGLHTLGADGTHTGTNTQSFGDGNPSEQGPFSEFHGVWEQTGSRQITITTFIMLFNPDGKLALWARPNVVLNFDEDFEIAEGTLATLVFAPTQDPNDPEEIPIVTFEGTTTFRRTHVVDLCN